MRTPSLGRFVGVLAGIVLLAGAARGEQTLRDAYAAILSGDYSGGRTALEHLATPDASMPEVARAVAWLDSFEKTRTTRDELRKQTFEWTSQRAREALGESKTYLALSFAVQASAYAPAGKPLSGEPWLKELRDKALAEAEQFMKDEKWSKAHAYYYQLERIDEKDEVASERREAAARHVRLEVLYDSAESVERRIEGVHPALLEQSLGLISDNYYQPPDFRKMAEGAVDQLVALAQSTKLYDASDLFNGIANPAAREHFLGKLQELRARIAGTEKWGSSYRDLIRLYREISDANRTSVSLPEGLLVIEFTEGAIGVLDDFTSVVWPADASDFDKMMIGNFFGVGIQLGIDEDSGRLKVVTPLENSPALEAGIQPDDLIVAVNGESTKGWSSDQAVREITGPEGTRVALTIFRPSTGKTLDFPLVRRQIQLTTVRGVNRVRTADGFGWNYMLDPDSGVALIRLTGFNPDSQRELVSALRDARKQGMKGLVLDLRYNPGGLLDVAIDIVSTFLPQGEVVSTNGRREPAQRHAVTGDSEFADLPLVVLVNEQSASASEILSGALQDHHRAIVLGDRTFGKGSVQRVLRLDRRFPIGGGAASDARLKLTTALYYLPSGRTPHRERDAERWGVEPDWVIGLTPKEMSECLRQQRDAYIIHNEDDADRAADADAVAAGKEALRDDAGAEADEADGDEDLLSEDDLKLLRSDPFEAPPIDAQLEAALLQLRIKMAGNLPWPQQLAQGEQPARP